MEASKEKDVDFGREYLREILDALKRENSSLQRENSSLQNDKKILQNDKINLNRDKEILQKEKKEMKILIGKLREENEKLQKKTYDTMLAFEVKKLTSADFSLLSDKQAIKKHSSFVNEILAKAIKNTTLTVNTCDKESIFLEASCDWNNVKLKNLAESDFQKSSFEFYKKLCDIMNRNFPEVLFTVEGQHQSYVDSAKQTFKKYDLIIWGKGRPSIARSKRTTRGKLVETEDKILKKPPFIIELKNSTIDLDEDCVNQIVGYLKIQAAKTPIFQNIHGLLTNGREFRLYSLDYSEASVEISCCTIDIAKKPESYDLILKWIIDKLSENYITISPTYFVHPKTGSKYEVSLQRVLGKGATSSVFSVSLRGSSDEDCVIKNVTGNKLSALENEIDIYDWLNQCGISCVPLLKGYITKTDDPVGSIKVGLALPKGTPLNNGMFQDYAISYLNIHSSFLELFDELSKIHNEAKVLHRDIRPENLLLMQDKKLALIDWGFAVRFDGAQYVGPYAGSIRTASKSVLEQVIKDAQKVSYGPADDIESLVKTYYLLQLRSEYRNFVAETKQDVLDFWEQHSPFMNLTKAIEGNFTDVVALKKCLLMPVKIIPFSPLSFC